MPEPEWAGRRISLLAYGKVNLTLAVTGRRQDGYHTLCGVMQSIGLGNRLTLAASPRNSGEPAVSLRCDDPQLPTDRRNTAAKAAFAFLEEAGLQTQAHLAVFVEKRIPYQAGLGSASADAAGVLAGANALFGRPLSQKRLLSLAASVGADVPFCLTGGTQRAEGIGEILTPLSVLPACALLIAKPPEGVSTPEAYARFDALPHPARPDCAALEAALAAGNLAEIASACGNAFEQCCPVPAVGMLNIAMREAGALGGAMSGSGPAVFGIFSNRQAACAAKEQLAPRFAGCRFFVTEPKQSGIVFA